MILDDGRYLVGGGVQNATVSPVAGFGMIFSNGNLDQSWGFDQASLPSKIVRQVDGYVFPYITGLL